MKVALVKNNKVENVILIENIQFAQEMFPDYDEHINVNEPINQDYNNQFIGIGFERKVDGTWYDPTFVPWTPPEE